MKLHKRREEKEAGMNQKITIQAAAATTFSDNVALISSNSRKKPSSSKNKKCKNAKNRKEHDSQDVEDSQSHNHNNNNMNSNSFHLLPPQFVQYQQHQQ